MTHDATGQQRRVAMTLTPEESQQYAALDSDAQRQEFQTEFFRKYAAKIRQLTVETLDGAPANP